MRSAAASRRYANSDGSDEGYDSRERNGGIVVDDVQELGRLADVNLAQTWALLARLMGVPVGRAESAVFVATGLDAAFFNGVYVAGPTHDPDAVVRDAIAFMSEQGVPWLLWVREGVDDELLAAGRRAGLTDAGGPPAMALASIGAPPEPPAELDVVVIDGPAGVDTFRDVTARGFEMPIDFTTRLVSEATLADPGIAAVLGTVAGEPVSVALVSVTGATAGIYMVATPDQHRRRGYGAAMTWAAIREGARLGCDHVILQASELGAPVYRDMGFVDIGRYVQLASR
jgi:GNAT superfamily N-acetyltransferase